MESFMNSIQGLPLWIWPFLFFCYPTIEDCEGIHKLLLKSLPGRSGHTSDQGSDMKAYGYSKKKLDFGFRNSWLYNQATVYFPLFSLRIYCLLIKSGLSQCHKARE